jgi:hypothetical protein
MGLATLVSLLLAWALMAVFLTVAVSSVLPSDHALISLWTIFFSVATATYLLLAYLWPRDLTAQMHESIRRGGSEE